MKLLATQSDNGFTDILLFYRPFGLLALKDILMQLLGKIETYYTETTKSMAYVKVY